MWSDCLDNTKFLYMLYNEVPLLDGVRIANISISDEGNRVTLVFDMPKYADHPPDKWRGCNVAVIEIDFFCVSKLHISTISNTYRGDIKIERNIEELLEISITGNITLQAVVEAGFIQHINAHTKCL